MSPKAKLAVLSAAMALAGTAPSAAIEADPGVAVMVLPSGEATLIHAEIQIAAPPHAVWGVIYDCAYAIRLMEKLKSCRVLDRDPAGRWDVREQIIQPLILPRLRAVMRSEYDPPYAVAFRQVEGDVKSQAGRWRLEPLRGGSATRAVYENRIVLGLPIGAPLFRQALRSEARKGLIKLKTVSELEIAPPPA